jgi:hypothetical protein
VNLTLPRAGHLNSAAAPFSVYGFAMAAMGRWLDGPWRLRLTQSQVMEHLVKTVGIQQEGREAGTR